MLRIPKLRAGTYFPEGLIERHSRADRAVAAAASESRANGVSKRKIKRRSRVVQVFPSVESVLRLVGAVCAERDEDWSGRRYISPEPMRRLSEPAEPDRAESEGSRRRGLMVVKTAMELAGGGRRAE